MGYDDGFFYMPEDEPKQEAPKKPPVQYSLWAALMLSIAAGGLIYGFVRELERDKAVERAKVAENSFNKLSDKFSLGERMYKYEVRDNVALRSEVSAQNEEITRLKGELYRRLTPEECRKATSYPDTRDHDERYPHSDWNHWDPETKENIR